MTAPSTTRWNARRLATLISELAASARERPGMGTTERITISVDRALWERAAVVASVVQREQAPAPPPPEHEDKRGGGATVTAMTAKRRRARKP